MFYVIDPDTILIIADMSGLTLVAESAAEVKLGLDSFGELLLDLDIDPSGGLSESDVIVLIRGENVFANYKNQEVDDADPITYIGQIKVSGEWLLTKMVDTAGDLAFSYANLSNNATMTTFNLAWTNRTTLTYTLISNLTGV